MKRITIVLLLVIGLLGCSPSAERIEKQWKAQEQTILEKIQAIEDLKAELPQAWEADLASSEPMTGLVDETSQIQQNIAQRQTLLEDGQKAFKSLEKYSDEQLTSPQLAQRSRWQAYFNLAQAGLDLELAFFKQMASGEFLRADLKQQREQIEANREQQRAAIESVTPLPPIAPVQTKEPNSGETETAEPEAVETAQPESSSESSSSTAKYRLNQATQFFEALGDAPAKAVLMTFDDVPISGDKRSSLEIAKVLKAHDVPAIFFVYGAYLNSDIGQETVKQLHEMGFEIGNHTQNHPDLTSLSEEAVRTELRTLNDSLEALIGERPKFFRPSFGQTNATVAKVAREEGMLPMNWSFGYDWEDEYQDAEALADIMVNTPLMGPGANLLMHDRANTAQAMEKIVLGLREKGYRFIDPQEIADETQD